MGLVWAILWYVIAGLLCLILLIFLLFVGLVITIIYQAEKFMFGLPWLKWLTFEDLPKLGFSKTWARFVLPMFHQDGYLEVRLIDEDAMDDFDHEKIERFGFSAATAPLYEFKLTKRRGRRKKWKLGDFSSLTKAWQPVRA